MCGPSSAKRVEAKAKIVGFDQSNTIAAHIGIGAHHREFGDFSLVLHRCLMWRW
jgi:hypothetical protein